MDTEVIQPSRSGEITALCDNVTSSVYIINSQVKHLKSVIDNIGTPKDNHQLREQIQAWQQEANDKIKAAQDDISKLNILSRMTNKEQKLQINKITNHFKDAIEGFCKIQEEVVQKICSNLVYQSDTPGVYSDESSAFIGEEQLEIQRNLGLQNQLLLEQQEGVKKIESDIVNLHLILKEMANRVHEQGTVVDTIENRLESAYQDVQTADQELHTAARYQSRKRKVYLVLFIVLVLSILIGVIVWSAKS